MSNLKGGTKKDTKMRIRAFPVSIYLFFQFKNPNFDIRVSRLTAPYVSTC